MSVFVDTSAFYALLDREDANHNRAKAAWSELLRSGETLTTSNYVLVETSALVQRRLGLAALRAFSEDIVPVLTKHWIGEKTHASAIATVLTATRKKLSLVDCASFLVMREAGLHRTFTFDRHFAEQGFFCIPDTRPRDKTGFE